MGAAPPELLGEVTAAAAYVQDGTPGDGTVVGLDLVGGVAGEQRVAELGIVLLVEEGTEEGRAPKEIFETRGRADRGAGL